ncbi:unnamed protein product [Lactuca saligna]|uniref:Uncharacterized protein n=1 Tax=Lactuca saligna TaxID=75948 RepID=A0AA35VAK9_LACSI|nr:unnamed protein product [Lactuca saligna]
MTHPRRIRCSQTILPISIIPSMSFKKKNNHAHGVQPRDHGSTEFFDPLRGQSTETLEPVENTAVVEKLPATQPTSHLSSKKELTSFNKLLMKRFHVQKMISVSSSDELNDSQKLKEGGFKIVSQQAYIKRMHGLKDEIMRSWHSEDRVTTLKLSIKVARLLMDTSVAQFYPTIFVLGVDIMDMLGDMVWDRIKQKVEFADDGTKICSLSDDFDANSICFEAKEEGSTKEY